MTGQRPKNYLVEAILVTFFCCMPLGIVAIINASQVNSKYDSGDIEGAIQASKEAKKWMKWALFGAIIFLVLYFLMFGIGIIISILGNS